MGRVCILDYGSGNVRSVFNLFSKIAKQVVVSNEPAEIQQATHIVLPGVGAFSAAMRKIRERLPMEELEQAVLSDKKPFLGICVGMQVLATCGMEFGESPGLGWIGGRVEKVDSKHLPLPHIGWNNITCKQSSPLLAGLGDDPDFYFVHSYFVDPDDKTVTAGITEYGISFCSMLIKDNLIATQFHPEKSGELGLKMYDNFLKSACK